MSTFSPLPFIVFEVGIFILGLICLIHAWRQERYLAAMMVAAVVYTFLAEFFETTQGQYLNGPFFMTLAGVPIVSPVAWSIMFYAIMKTSDRLGLPWQLRSLLDGLLILTITLSMDPIASTCNACGNSIATSAGLGFWIWQIPGEWFNVPLEDFAGDFILFIVFTFFVRLGRRWLPPGNNRSWGNLAIPFLAILLSFPGILILLQTYLWLTRFIPDYIVLPLILAASALAVFRLGPRLRQDNLVDPVVLAVPLFLHLFFLGALLLTGIYRLRPELLLLWLVIFMLSAVLFTWPYRGTLLSPKPARRVA